MTLINVGTARSGEEPDLPDARLCRRGRCLPGAAPAPGRARDRNATRWRTRSAGRGLHGRVGFAGLIDYAELPRYLAMADAFVTASVTEVHPLSVIEAMASGLPVLGIVSPGIEDTVEDGQTGYLRRGGPACLHGQDDEAGGRAGAPGGDVAARSPGSRGVCHRAHVGPAAAALREAGGRAPAGANGAPVCCGSASWIVGRDTATLGAWGEARGA